MNWNWNSGGAKPQTLSNTTGLTRATIAENRNASANQATNSVYFNDKTTACNQLTNQIKKKNLNNEQKIALAHLIKFISIATRDKYSKNPQCEITVEKVKQYLVNRSEFTDDQTPTDIAKNLISIANIESSSGAGFKEYFLGHSTISQTAKYFITTVLRLDLDKLELKSQHIDHVLNKQHELQSKAFPQTQSSETEAGIKIAREIYNIFQKKEISQNQTEEKKTEIKTKKYADGTYKGYIKNDSPHGKGTFIYMPNYGIISYAGTWENGKRHGVGTMTFADGATYEGSWENGKRHGSGTMTFANGATYDGSWVNGERHGRGVMDYDNGRTYQGSWVNGERHGRGVMHYDNSIIYEGSWVNDKRHGVGTMTFANGATYDGSWENGKIHGVGTMKFADGATYEGSWVNDKRHGVGTMTFADGATYEGSWVNDKIHGVGTMKFADGATYEGSWVNDKRHGVGTIKYNDSNLAYSGIFDDDILTTVDEDSITNFMKMMSQARKGKHGVVDGASEIFLKQILQRLLPQGNFIMQHQEIISSIIDKLTNVFAYRKSNNTQDINNYLNQSINPRLNDHAVIIKTSLASNGNESNVIVSIYNSGDGIEHHASKKFENGKVKFQLRQDYRMSLKDFQQNIVPLINMNTKVEDFYQALEKGEKIENLDYPYQSEQRGPNCNIESPNAYLLNELHEKLTKQHGKEEGAKIALQIYKIFQNAEKLRPNNETTQRKTVSNKRYKKGSYSGNTKDGKRHNEGMMKYDNGDIYAGDWYRNRKNGLGVMTYDNGDTHSGDWYRNRKNGLGVMKYNNGTTREGVWKNGKLDGEVFYTDSEGVGHKENWKNGKKL